MSQGGSQGSDAGPGLYDPVELRRRIVVCFTVGELRALAESLGVGGVAWERGVHEAAREVVRQCERYAGLPALVARLREMRPLVEWPEPASAVGAPPHATVDPPAAPADLHQQGNAPVPGFFPSLPASPGRLGPEVGGALLDPYAPAPGPPAIQVPLATPAAGAPRAGWPGTAAVAPAPAKPGGIDPRVLVAVAGLMVLAAIIAYLAGRASSVPVASEGASETASSTSNAAASPRGTGPGALAAGALARGFASLARVCELPSSAGTSALVFRRVFERCGPAAPAQRSYTPPLPAAPAATSTASAAPADPPAPRGKRGHNADSVPGEAAPTSRGCMGTCDSQHASCRAHCGAEPTESSAYDGFQRCLGRCLSDASRCRLGCR